MGLGFYLFLTPTQGGVNGIGEGGIAVPMRSLSIFVLHPYFGNFHNAAYIRNAVIAQTTRLLCQTQHQRPQCPLQADYFGIFVGFKLCG